VNTEYGRLAPLRRVQESIDRARFERLSCFLKQPRWEATSNGAERMGRAFRHRPGPHFNLRTPTSIAADLTVRACLQKQAAGSPVVLVARGRTNRQIAELLGVTERTVGAHLEHVFARLGLQSRTQVGVWAAQQGLL
jgi:DNA-binding CsgD family transcriptional regulator